MTKSNSDELLKHEQLHFDISELKMRILRKSFQDYVFSGTENFNNDLKKRYSETSKEISNESDVYDIETNHGILKKKQREWEKKVHLELEKLKEYINVRVKIVKKM